jgi:DNA-binding response OmpR family regulator
MVQLNGLFGGGKMAGQKRVLIIEDEKPLQHALQLKLQREGFETVTGENGHEALELLKSQAFDVVLLDLMMPEIDGFQVLEQRSTFMGNPAVFVLSNLSQHEDEERVMALGATKFFIKSDTPLSLIVDEVTKA